MDSSVVGKKKAKVLKDITNTPLAKPDKPKPRNAGPKVVDGPLNEPGSSKWADSEVSLQHNGGGPSVGPGGSPTNVFGPSISKSTPTRPPDLPLSNLGQNPSKGVRRLKASNGDSGRAETDRIEMNDGISGVVRRSFLEGDKLKKRSCNASQSSCLQTKGCFVRIVEALAAATSSGR